MERMGSKPGAGAGGDNNDEVDPDDANNGQDGGSKLGSTLGKDGAKPVNGGLEIYNKMDIKFTMQKKIPEWAMACADEIRQEFANRGRLRYEAISLAQKLFHKTDTVHSLNTKAASNTKKQY